MSSRIAAHVDLAKVSFTGSCVTGRLILQDGIEVDPSKVSAISDWPRPASKASCERAQ